MSKIAIISAALVSVGFGVEFAVQEAERLAPKLTSKGKVTKAPTKKGGVGLEASVSLSDRILGYARSRKGNVWSLSAVALATGGQRNAISAQLTHLVKNGTLNRTGRGEYVLNRKN